METKRTRIDRIMTDEWKKTTDRLGKPVLENENMMITLPIKYEGKTTKTGNDTIQVRGYKKKLPDLTIRFERYTIMGTKEIRNSDALDGKKIRVIIEVIGE